MFFKTVPFMNNHDVDTRYRPRFFDQVGHQIMYASMGNKHFFNKQSSDLPKLRTVSTKIGYIFRKQSTLKQ